MTEAQDRSEKEVAEGRRWFLEAALVALTAVENTLVERTPETEESIKLLKEQYAPEEIAEGAMIVLTTLVAHASDSSDLPVSVHVQHLRELMLATLDEQVEGSGSEEGL